MSETANETVAASPEAPAEAKKGGGKKFILIGIVLVLLLGGGGAGFYFWRVAGAQAAADGEPEKKAGEKKASTKKAAEEEPEETTPQRGKMPAPRGDRLPGERELSRRLDVSRPILREALKELESRGLLVSQHGGFQCPQGGLTADFIEAVGGLKRRRGPFVKTLAGNDRGWRRQFE